MRSSIPLALEIDGRRHEALYIVAGDEVIVSVGGRCASRSIGRLGPTFAARSLIRDLVRQRGFRVRVQDPSDRPAVRLVPRIP